MVNLTLGIVDGLDKGHPIGPRAPCRLAGTGHAAIDLSGSSEKLLLPDYGPAKRNVMPAGPLQKII